MMLVRRGLDQQRSYAHQAQANAVGGPASAAVVIDGCSVASVNPTSCMIAKLLA